MTALKHTMAAIPGGNTRRTYGTAHWDGSRWYARIADSLLEARWLDPIQPLQGGKIVIDITNDGQGQSTALVIGGYTDQPRPSTGTVLSVGLTEIVFTGEDGTVYATDRFIGSYGFGDLVFFVWAAGKPVIVGPVPTITEVHTPAPLAPIGTTAGETALIATASDTYGGGLGWGSYATSQRGGEDVYSGTWSGRTVSGAWFYGAPKPELAGKTVDRVRFKVPARMAVGAHGAPVTIYLYAHNSGARPSGDVTRVAGPFPVTIQPGFAGGYIDIDPATFAPHLVAGGGLSIAGGDYVAFQGRLSKYSGRHDPESGKTILNWSS